ncbi:signal transduction histidine kinase [Pullulanibacillus pueri]|uniref:histidine kinase n=1 Tax=Pullulanibacillus pueri TaxID=1437324 RepID=A0A8J2ZZH8_9BACL|nr:ATP-binding protein [Pullulanibacillus pueri]MBM7684029.1 signal transduction histidine kinase [Pullulanibacillus pueri]GGH88518.1 hypothetical protein GCM10007096_41040 [Pullulanibacillus pueri]
MCQSPHRNLEVSTSIEESKRLSLAGQLAAGIAHEIRNPLTAIKGFLQLIQKDFTGNTMYLEVITKEINRIELILSELLGLAKPHESKFEKKHLNDTLDHVMTLIQTQANMKGINLIKAYAKPLPECLYDENKLKQVFINLLKNAIEAMPQGGDILTQAESNDTHLRILIKDQGVGIPENHIGNIGQPFFTTKEKGTGLGLAVCQQIIREHSGILNIRSNATGTTIEIVLPIKNEGAQ